MQIKLGISTGFATKRWAVPEDWIRIVKNDLGLDLIQFSFDQYDPRSNSSGLQRYCDRVRNSCDRFGVTIHSTFTGLSIYSHNLLYHPLLEGRIDALDWFEKSFAMTSSLGVNATGGPIGGMDIQSFQNLNKRTYLERWAEEAIVHLLGVAGTRYGIQSFYWEQTPVLREGTVTLEGTTNFIERINESTDDSSTKFSLCLDVGHFTSDDTPAEERDPYYWIEQSSHLAPVIHLQQSDGYLDRHWPFTAERNRNGIIEPKRVYEALVRSGRDEVVLFLEIGHAFEERDAIVLQEIKESVSYWKDAFRKLNQRTT